MVFKLPNIKICGLFNCLNLIFNFPFLIIIFSKKRLNFNLNNLNVKSLLTLVIIIFNFKNFERMLDESKMPLHYDNNLRIHSAYFFIN